jgi:hypothetical protein
MWQPIETAPDAMGTFLVAGEGRIVLPDYIFSDGERVRWAIERGPDDPEYGIATHWMQLPEPPA